MDWILLFGVIGVWLLVFVFAKLLRNLNQGVKAQQEIIKSFESQSTYFTNIHDAVRKLYDPEEIKNIVNIRVEKAEREIKTKTSESMKIVMRDYRLASVFTVSSLMYLNDSAIETILKNIKQEGVEDFQKFIRETREEILKVRAEALAEALGSSPKKGLLSLLGPYSPKKETP